MSETRIGRRFGHGGFSLVEIMIATAILGVMIVSALELFSTTQRQAVTSESLMNAGVLAQIVSERVRQNIDSNPRYLRDLIGTNPAWSFTGSVVDPASATKGAPQMSPFFEYLMTREAADVCAPANQVSIKTATAATPTGMQPAELQSLVETFRDFQVKVRIENDVDLASPTAPTALAELVKVVTVTAERISLVEAKGADPLAFTMSVRVITPCDSLSDAAIDILNGRFEGPTLSELLGDFFLVASTNPYFSASQLKQGSKDTLACAFLAIAGANTEGLLTDNEVVPGSAVIDTSGAPDFIESWITKFSAADAKDLSSSKAELAALRRRKATVIFDTFKKIRLPMEHLVEQVIGPLPAAAVAAGEETLLVKIRALLVKLQTDITAMTAFQTDMNSAITSYQDQQAQIDLLTKQATAIAAKPPIVKIVYDSTANTTNTITFTPSTNSTTTKIYDPTSGTTKTKVESPSYGATLYDPTTNTTQVLIPPDPNAPSLDQQLADALAAQAKAEADLAAATAAYELQQQQTQTQASKDVEIVVLASFLQQLFTNTDYAPTAARPGKYSTRFKNTIDQLGTGLAEHLDLPLTDVTPFERMRAAQGFLEATKVRQLEAGGADATAQARIMSLSNQYATKEGQLSSYLKSSEATDFTALQTRNKTFVARVADLKRLSPQYQAVLDQLLPGGEIANFLANYGQYFNTQKPEGDKLLKDAGKILDGWKKKKKD